MEKVQKQIRESFFNPILQILPLPVFLAVENLWGITTAWIVVFPFTLVLITYVYFMYNRIFGWHMMFELFFLASCTIASLAYLLPIPAFFKEFSLECIFFICLSLLLFKRKKFQKTALKIVPGTIPMSNNFRETLFFLYQFYGLLGAYLIVNLSKHYFNSTIISYIKPAFFALLAGLLIYELIRVQIIRRKLLGEEWWPIVTDQGKIVGSIQHLTSLKDCTKFMHPIIRVMIIDRGMVLLQKRSDSSLIYPGMWDTVITNHVRMGESIEKCIDRTAEEHYNLNNFRYMFLSNYTLEVTEEKHYAFLFVSCQEMAYHIDPEHSKQLKWWTQHQIEENINAGIFPENFKIEYDLLKRSGLLESGKCECNCRLKEVIAQQARQVIKNELN